MMFDTASFMINSLSKNFRRKVYKKDRRIVRQYLICKHPKQCLNPVFHQISRHLAGGTEKLSHAWWGIPVLIRASHTSRVQLNMAWVLLVFVHNHG